MHRIPFRKTDASNQLQLNTSLTSLSVPIPEPLSSTPLRSPKERAEFFPDMSWTHLSKINIPSRRSKSLTPEQGNTSSGERGIESETPPASPPGSSNNTGVTGADSEEIETPLRSPPLVSMANKTFQTANGTNFIAAATDADPYTNNWTQWTVWQSVLMNLFNSDAIQNETMHPMVHMSKEEFGSLVTDAVRKVCSEFEPLGTNFILIKVKKLGLSPQNDQILYIQQFFCYSKFSQKIEIGADEVMFTGRSYDPTSKLILRLAAHQELAQMLAACLTLHDLVLIRGSLGSLVYDEKDKSLTLNQELRSLKGVGVDECPIPADNNNGHLDVIRFPIDDYWRHYYKGQVLVEKIIPAKFASNFFTFTYSATDEVTKLNSSTRKSEVHTVQKQYRKPKSFTLEDFFQREVTRRFAHQIRESPFQIPISRGIGPFDAYRVLIECDDLFSPSATASASMLKVTPPQSHKVKNSRRFAHHPEVGDKHETLDFLTEDEDESGTRVNKPSSSSKYAKKCMNKSLVPGRRSTDPADRRMQIVIILLSLVLIMFAIFQYQLHVEEGEAEMELMEEDDYSAEYAEVDYPDEYATEIDESATDHSYFKFWKGW